MHRDFTVRLLKIIFIWLFITIFPSLVLSDPVLVVKKNFPLDEISRQEVINIWLGKKRSMANLGRVRVVDLLSTHPLYSQFYKDIVGFHGRRLDIYWSKRIFSGKSSRPKQVESIDDVIMLITKVPGVIGYIDDSAVTDELKTLRILR